MYVYGICIVAGSLHQQMKEIWPILTFWSIINLMTMHLRKSNQEQGACKWARQNTWKYLENLDMNFVCTKVSELTEEKPTTPRKK